MPEKRKSNPENIKSSLIKVGDHFFAWTTGRKKKPTMGAKYIKWDDLYYNLSNDAPYPLQIMIHALTKGKDGITVAIKHDNRLTTITTGSGHTTILLDSVNPSLIESELDRLGITSSGQALAINLDHTPDSYESLSNNHLNKIYRTLPQYVNIKKNIMNVVMVLALMLTWTIPYTFSKSVAVKSDDLAIHKSNLERSIKVINMRIAIQIKDENKNESLIPKNIGVLSSLGDQNKLSSIEIVAGQLL